MSTPLEGRLHHVELWVPNLTRALDSFGWLLTRLGYAPYQKWAAGRSWQLGNTYIVLEQSSALTSDVHHRCHPGLNHLAFHGGSTSQVDQLVREAPNHGWTLMFADRHPHAGGPGHYAG